MNHSVSFLILSNSNKKKWNLIEDTYLYKYSIPSIIDCVNFCNSKNFNYNFKLFVGIDDDDEFLINLIDQYTLLLSHLNNVQIEFVKFNNIKKGYLTKMWNVLFKKAYHENFDYFYQMGDDIKFNYVDWIPDAINSLVSNDNIGVTGPPCTVHNIILTQSFVSRKHMDIFGFYFPEDDIVNQYCDDWINMIYFPSHRFYLRKTLTNMCVAMDRGEDRYEIVRLKVQDVVGKHQHKLLSFIENNKPPNSNGLIAEDFIVDWVLKNDGLLFTRKINNFNTTPNNKSKKLICVTGSSNLLQQLSQLIEQFDHKITLIIIETDQTPISQNLIDNPKIKHIFAWNIPFNHPKLTAIPIGINYTRHFQTLNSFLSDHTPTQPEKLVAINFSLDTNHTRRILMLKAESPPWNEFCDCLQHIPNKVSYIKDSLIEGKLNNDVTPADYYKTIQNYKFILSPPGAGLDCHRTWETLYLDRIPIVLKSPLNELYENLPVVVVDNWDVITKDFLETKYSEITENKRQNKYNMEKITITHLLNSFNTMLDLL